MSTVRMAMRIRLIVGVIVLIVLIVLMIAGVRISMWAIMMTLIPKKKCQLTKSNYNVCRGVNIRWF